MKHIVAIVPVYPSPALPYSGTFIDQLFRAFGRHGVSVTVLNPLSIYSSWRAGLRGVPPITVIEQDGGAPVTVFRRLYPSLRGRLGPVPTSQLTTWGYERSVSKLLSKVTTEIDAFYGHFLYLSGFAAIRFGQQYHRPSFLAAGECDFTHFDPYLHALAQERLPHMTGLVAVSTPLKQQLIHEFTVPADKIAVFPNGTDQTLFYPRDRQAMRRELGLPLDATIGIFIGSFDHRKGVLRVAEAARAIPNLSMAYLGRGPLNPEGERILWKGPVAHQDIPKWLSAADFFVLPTLTEGSCNAALEAMSCGLPVISSLGDFNDDILHDEVAIRVDPMDVATLQSAMTQLTNEVTLRTHLASNALTWASRFNIDQRASGIITFMREQIIRRTPATQNRASATDMACR